MHLRVFVIFQNHAMVKANIVLTIFTDKTQSPVRQTMEVKLFATMVAVARIHLNANFYGVLLVKPPTNVIAKI